MFLHIFFSSVYYIIIKEISPIWHLCSHLCRPQLNVFKHGNGHIWSMSMQHCWLQLCLPQNLFFLQRFSQSASNVSPKFWQAISRFMLPHRHLTSVLRSQSGHLPTWQGALHVCRLPVRKIYRLCALIQKLNVIRKHASALETLTRHAAVKTFRADFIASWHGICATLSLLRQRRLTATTGRDFIGRQRARLARFRMANFLALMFPAVQQFIANTITGISSRDIGSARYLPSLFTAETN